MKRLLLILPLLFIGCREEAPEETHTAKEPTELVHLASDKLMKKIDGGYYEPFFGQDSTEVKVESFLMDETPVTNAEFLEFVKKNPQWSKSKVLRIYADSAYLANWPSDFELSKNLSPQAPVTNVSWFAAKAYAESVGKRLPTLDEWEYVARADAKKKDARNEEDYTQNILVGYQQHNSSAKEVKTGVPNVWGVYDMFGLVWEWTDDFSSVMMSGESRKDASTDQSLFCAGASLTSKDLTNYAAFMRFAMRGSINANYSINNMGFRCAKDLK